MKKPCSETNSILDSENPYKCLKCFDNCKSCLDTGPFKCTSCKEGHYFDYYDSTCSKKCFLHQYYNYSIGLCMRCPPNCVMCQNSTSCDLCVVGKKLIRGKCRSKCLDNYYEVPYKGDGKCKLCEDKNCKRCPYNGVCKSCNFGYILDEETSNCTQSCEKVSHWLDLSNKRNKRCKKCIDGCSRCKGVPCDYCKFGYSRKDGKCYKRANYLIYYLVSGGIAFLLIIICCGYLMNQRKKRRQLKMREEYKAKLKKRDKVILAQRLIQINDMQNLIESREVTPRHRPITPRSNRARGGGFTGFTEAIEGLDTDVRRLSKISELSMLSKAEQANQALNR